MQILLDTHIYLWLLAKNSKLSTTALSLVENATKVYVSSVSIWEAAIKIKLGKLQADVNQLIAAIYLSGFYELPLIAAHINSLQEIPDLHRDPFDRVLIAQAISEPLRFLTADKKLRHYSELVEVV